MESNTEQQQNSLKSAGEIRLSARQAHALTEQYGSPLYVYDEAALRLRARELRHLIRLPGFRPYYSVKANTNLSLLRIIREEGYFVDAMSRGEIALELAAGYQPNEIYMVTNNIGDDEIRLAIEKGVLMSADSIEQLERFGMICPGGEIGVRLNPGIGDGHSERVVTGGSCKFGIEFRHIPEIQRAAERYGLRIVAINQHVGSLFLNDALFLAACDRLLSVAEEFPALRMIDFGGGFGVPYHGEQRLDLLELSARLTERVNRFLATSRRPDMHFAIEAGRYPVAECCELLGTVESRKEVCGIRYVGTDIGFNVLIRPLLYQAYHEIEIFPREEAETEEMGQSRTREYETVHVVGDICESGDILAKDRLLPVTRHGDLIGIRNAGAYGYSMSSNYNSRLRPAEVLLRTDGSVRLIRKRDTIEDLLRPFQGLSL